MKNLNTLLADLDEQVDDDLITPLDGIEEEYLLYNQMRFNWLSYRTGVKTHLSLFTHDIDSSKPGKSLLKSWRETGRGKKRSASSEEIANIKKVKVE